MTDPDSDIPPEAAQNPAGLLGSLGDALGAAAGVLGGEGAAGAATAEVLDIFAGGFQQAGVDVAAAQADRMANPAFGDEALEMLRPHADRFVPTSLGWYYPDRPDPAARFEPLESYCLAGSDPIPGCVDDETRRNLIDNYTLAGERPDGALLGAIFRMKPGETFEYSTPDGSTMRVTDAEYWLAYNSFEPILVYFEGTTASADGPQPITVSRETDRYADVHTLRLPHRTRLRLGGAFDLAALTAAAGRSLQEIATEVVRAKANPGPLSSSEIRDILAEVLQDPEIAARRGN